MGKITFRFEDESLETQVIPTEKGMTILEIAEDNDIHLNHNCGEVCACSTCHVYVEKGDELLKEISDREEDLSEFGESLPPFMYGDQRYVLASH